MSFYFWIGLQKGSKTKNTKKTAQKHSKVSFYFWIGLQKGQKQKTLKKQHKKHSTVSFLLLNFPKKATKDKKYNPRGRREMITNLFFSTPIPAQNNQDPAKEDLRIPENGHNDFPVWINFGFFYARTVTSTDDALMMCEARWSTLPLSSRCCGPNSRFLCRSTMEHVHGILLEHVYGIVLDEKFLYRSVHAAFVNTKWYEAWLERTLLLDPIIFDMWIPGVLSRAPGPASWQPSRKTQDTPPLVVPCLRCGSFLYHKSVGGRGCGQEPDAFFPLARAAAATWRILGWNPRSSLILVVSLAISFCVSRRVSSLLVFLAESRHCLCFLLVGFSRVSSLLVFLMLVFAVCLNSQDTHKFGGLSLVHYESTSTRSWCSSAARLHGSFVTVKTQASWRSSGHRARCFRVLLRPAQHAHEVFARIRGHGTTESAVLKRIHHKDRRQLKLSRRRLGCKTGTASYVRYRSRTQSFVVVLFARHWPVSALPPAKRRARLNTCRSRPVRARCTRCRCYNCVCSCVTFPSQVHRRQTPSTSSSCSGWAGLVVICQDKTHLVEFPLRVGIGARCVRAEGSRSLAWPLGPWGANGSKRTPWSRG